MNSSSEVTNGAGRSIDDGLAVRLKDLPERIRYCHRLQQPSDDIELTVVGVYRYFKDPSFYVDTDTRPSPRDYNDLDVYDVLLTDGVELMKCLLSPACNRLVQTFQLHAGRSVRLNPSDCVVHSSERRVDCTPFVIINHLRLSGYNGSEFSLENMRFCDGPYSLELLECPLVTTRGCYMSLWNNEDPIGSCWAKPGADRVQNLPDSTVAVKRLALSWRTMPRPYPALVVRVLHRARIHCFAKHDKTEKWPFQLQLVVADKSGVISVVGWNRVTCELFNQVQEGLILLITGYTIRSRYALMSKPHDRLQGIEQFDHEIVLNAGVAVVKILDSSSFRVRSLVPLLEYFCRTKQELRHLTLDSNGLNLDFVGTVCHVGRYMRQRTDELSSQFWTCRWVHLLDGSSLRPIRLLLYCTSQPEEHGRIVPGVILFATQLRLVLTELQSAVSHHQETYITTTTYSQVYVFENVVPEPFASLPVVRNVIDWRSSEAGQAHLRSSFTIAGLEPCSVLPHTFENYRKTFSADKPLQPTRSTVIPDLALNLSYRECKRVHFLGYIASVSFHRITRDAPPLANHSSSSVPSTSSQAQTRSTRKRINDDADSGFVCSPPKSQRVFYESDVLSVDIDPLWRGMNDMETVGSAVPHPSFFARKYCRETDLNVIKQSLLMPSETSNPNRFEEPSLEDLPIVGWLEGYFVVSILGVNDNLAIRGFLPLPQNSGNCPQLDDLYQAEPALMRVLSGRLIEWPNGLAAKPLSDRVRWMLQDSRQLHKQRMLFVLDFYKPSTDDLIEVSIIRGFLTNSGDSQ